MTLKTVDNLNRRTPFFLVGVSVVNLVIILRNIYTNQLTHMTDEDVEMNTVR